MIEFLGKKLKDYNITIYATDIDTDALDNAKIGKYSKKEVEEVKIKLLDKYFHFDGYYRIKEYVKELVDFSVHDLTSEKKSLLPEVFLLISISYCVGTFLYISPDLSRKKYSVILIKI